MTINLSRSCRRFALATLSGLLLLTGGCATLGGTPSGDDQAQADDDGSDAGVLPTKASPKRSRITKGGVATAAVDPSRSIFFASDSSRVPNSAGPLLDEVAEQLKGDRHKNVLLVAHTDDQGSPEFCVALAERRASAVVTELVKRGVRSAQIQKMPVGSEGASPTCRNESCRQQERRVEVRLIE